MGVLEKLEPNRVFAFFEDLSRIPRGSGNTKAVSDYCVQFARERGLKCRQDSANNVVIWKDAAPGYENARTVMLQGHLDMVCEKTADCKKNLDTEGLDLFVDGDLVGAQGTTLGADDGIAVAMALAILDADELPHPALEAVFTTEEEIGMLGADALEMSDLKSSWLLNLDSEEEGTFIVGCAGGNLTVCDLPVNRTAFDGTALAVTVGGLTGGHSGAEISKGRANSSMLLGRILDAVGQKTELRVVSVDGGTKDNAIPRESTAEIVAADAAAARSAISEITEALRHEYQGTDPELFVRAENAGNHLLPADSDSTDRILCLLNCVPNGVQTMSQDIAGLVQTSLNLGILTTDDQTVHASFCIRSSVATQKEMLVRRLKVLMKQLGGHVSVSGDYPGWEFRRDSQLRSLMVDVFKEQYGRPPKVEAMHAGVECGLFCDRIPGLDCISYGPDLLEIHTARERMSISSVQRVWNFTLEVLKRCC